MTVLSLTDWICHINFINYFHKDNGNILKSRIVKFAIVSVIVILVLIISLHFSGVIQIHRIPHIFMEIISHPVPPDISNPSRYERTYFSFSYPSNWKIDKANKYFKPDEFIILDAPTDGQVRIQIINDEIDDRETVNDVIQRFSLPGLKVSSQDDFSLWGNYPGYGVTLLGDIIDKPFKARIFSHSEVSNSLVVWEYWWDGEKSINKSGFQLIEKSFIFEKSN